MLPAMLYAMKTMIKAWAKGEEGCSKVNANYIVALFSDDYLLVEVY